MQVRTRRPARRADEGDRIALVALDDTAQSWQGGERPVFGVLRARHDLGQSSTLGAVATDREDGTGYSRLLGIDGRIYHDKLYYVELQAVQSWTDSAGVIHFSDTLPVSRPPAPDDDDPVVLDEDTPVPATLNELLGADESAPATVQPVTPAVAPPR